jgi:hypothetical protein
VSLIHPLPKAEPSQTYWTIGKTLCIGKIINSKGEEVESLVLEPQGIAHLVSSEIINLPQDTCGFAHVLTRKCNQGLLTLNIGVIDPGWSNYISTSILNFSAERRLLTVGEPFIRTTFHKVSLTEDGEFGKFPEDRTRNNDSTSTYASVVRNRAVADFGKHFLNIRQLVGKASKKENSRSRDALLKYLPIAAFSLAFFALLVTIGVATVARISTAPSPQVNGEIELLSKQIRNLTEEIEKIKANSSQSHVTRPASATIHDHETALSGNTEKENR